MGSSGLGIMVGEGGKMPVVISADLVITTTTTTTKKKTGKHQTTTVWRPGCIYNIRNLDSLEGPGRVYDI